MNETKRIGTDETLMSSQVALKQQLDLLIELNSQLVDKQHDFKMVAHMMLWQVIESCHTILVMADMRKLRDSYIVGRSIFECAVNIGYFGVKGKVGIDKALKHAHQKTYRDLQRSVTIDDIHFAVGLKDIDIISMPPHLNEAIKEFTSNKGFEIRAWSGDNVINKIKLIKGKFGNKIGLGYLVNIFYIYRHSSEYIHGTLFGVMHSVGLTKLSNEWPTDRDSQLRDVNTKITFLLQNLTMLIVSLIDIIDMECGFIELSAKSHELLSNYHDKIQKMST